MTRTALDFVAVVAIRWRFREGELLYSVHALRGIAAIAVVAHHAAQFIGIERTIGAAGVDLFFVISGLVIGITTKPSSSVAEFCAKRFIRVVPLYWLATIIYMAFGYYAWHRAPELTEFVRSVLFLPRFGSDAMPIYYPGWTLYYEMMFYLTFAAALALFRSHVVIFVAILMGSFAALRHCIPFSTGHYYTELWLEFAFGGVLSEIIRRTSIDSRIGTTCLAAALMLFATKISYQPTDLPRIVEWGIPSLLLIAGLLSFDTAKLWRHPLIVAAGNASYAMYLTHITTISVVEILYHHSFDSKSSAVLAFVLYVVASILVGIAVHYWVEAPMLRWLRATYRRLVSKPQPSAIRPSVAALPCVTPPTPSTASGPA